MHSPKIRFVADSLTVFDAIPLNLRRPNSVGFNVLCQCVMCQGLGKKRSTWTGFWKPLPHYTRECSPGAHLVRPASKSMSQPFVPVLYPRHTELGVPFSQLQQHNVEILVGWIVRQTNRGISNARARTHTHNMNRDDNNKEEEWWRKVLRSCRAALGIG